MITLNCKLWNRQLICIAAAALSMSSVCVCVCVCVTFFVSIQKSPIKKLHTYQWQVQVNEKLETCSSNYPVGSSPKNYVLG